MISYSDVCCTCKVLQSFTGCGYGWHVGDCGVHVVGKISNDIGMGLRKGTVVSFVPTLFGCFLGIPSLYVFSFFLNVFLRLVSVAI